MAVETEPKLSSSRSPELARSSTTRANFCSSLDLKAANSS